MTSLKIDFTPLLEPPTINMQDILAENENNKNFSKSQDYIGN